MSSNVIQIGITYFTISPKTILLLQSYNQRQYIEGQIIKTCHTCHNTLKKNKIPCIAHFNNLDPGPMPDDLKILNPIERSLISRIKPFMKIFNINNYKNGQAAFKGIKYLVKP